MLQDQGRLILRELQNFATSEAKNKTKSVHRNKHTQQKFLYGFSGTMSFYGEV